RPLRRRWRVRRGGTGPRWRTSRRPALRHWSASSSTWGAAPARRLQQFAVTLGRRDLDRPLGIGPAPPASNEQPLRARRNVAGDEPFKGAVRLVVLRKAQQPATNLHVEHVAESFAH